MMSPDDTCRDKTPTSKPPRISELSILFYILAIAFFLRIYHLDTPTLDADELFILIPSSLGWEYLFNFLKQYSTATPLFYCFTKALLALSHSDFALRIFQALTGCLTIALVYFLGKQHLNPRVALMAAALLSTNELHLAISRQARPYVFFVLLALLSFHYLLNYVGNSSKRNLMNLVIVNFFLLSIHFLSLFVIPAEFLVLLYYSFLEKRIKLTAITSFAAFSVLSFLPNVYFLFYAMQNTLGAGKTAITYWELFNSYTSSLMSCIGLYEGLLYNFLAIAIVILGMVVALRENRVFFAISVTSILYPLAFLLITKLKVIDAPQHLSFLSFFVAYLISTAVIFFTDIFRLSSVAIIALTTLSGYHIYHDKYDKYYTSDSCLHWYNLGSHKVMAKHSLEFVRPGEALSTYDPFFFEATNWYLDQYLNKNYIREQAVDNKEPILSFNFIGMWDWNSIPAEVKESLRGLDTPEKSDAFDVARYLKWTIHRTPTQHIGDLPFVRSFSAKPSDFYKNIALAKNVFFLPPFEGQIVPTTYESPGSFEYHFHNNSSTPPRTIYLVPEYHNDGVNNRFTVKAQFDDEPVRVIYDEIGRGSSHRQILTIPRETPFNDLFIRFEMTAALVTPTPGITNLQSIGFKGMHLYACDPVSENACQLAIMADHLPTALPPADSPLPQRFLPEASQNIVASAGDVASWDVFATQEKSMPGRLRFEVSRAATPVVFLPRLCGPRDFFSIFAVAGERREMLFHLNGPATDCTPIGMRVPLPDLPAWAQVVEIELFGGAQVWHKNQQALFPGP